MIGRRISFIGASIVAAALVITPMASADTMANGCVGAAVSTLAQATQQNAGIGLGQFAKSLGVNLGQAISDFNQNVCKAP
jgi:cobalamin biosynthesis protein CobD/CbiB